MVATLTFWRSLAWWVEGSHERQAFRLSESFCAPRTPYEGLFVIWRTYSSFIPSRDVNACGRLVLSSPLPEVQRAWGGVALSPRTMTISIDTPCTGFTFDMVAGSRLERKGALRYFAQHQDQRTQGLVVHNSSASQLSRWDEQTLDIGVAKSQARFRCPDVPRSDDLVFSTESRTFTYQLRAFPANANIINAARNLTEKHQVVAASVCRYSSQRLASC